MGKINLIEFTDKVDSLDSVNRILSDKNEYLKLCKGIRKISDDRARVKNYFNIFSTVGINTSNGKIYWDSTKSKRKEFIRAIIVKSSDYDKFTSIVKEMLDAMNITDYKLEEPSTDIINASGTYLSIKVSIQLCSTLIEFYITNLGANTRNAIEYNSNILQPKNLNIIGSYLNYNEYIKAVKENIRINTSINCSLIHLISGITSNNRVINCLTEDSLDATYTINDKNLYRYMCSLDKTSINSIQCGFGEIVSPLILCDVIKKDLPINFPESGSNALYDYEYACKSISVKAKNSNYGCPPSLFTLCNSILKTKYKVYDKLCSKYGKTTIDNFYNVFKILQSDDVIKMFNATNKIILCAIYLVKEYGSKYEIENIKKILMFASIDVDDVYKKILEITRNKKATLKEFSKNELTKSILQIDKNEFDKISDLSILNFAKKNKTKLPYFDYDGKRQLTYEEKIIGHQKLSNVMYGLECKIIEIMNNEFIKDVTESNIFSDVINPIVLGYQSEMMIKIANKSESIIVNGKFYKLKNKNFIFCIKGAGQTDYNGHGTLGFKVID